MDQLLRDHSGKLRLKIYNDAGDLLDADANPTAEIFDSAGTRTPDSTLATTKPVATTGTYELALTPPMTAKLDEYSVVWTYQVSTATHKDTTFFAVVGGFFFTQAEARTADGNALASETKYPDADLVAGRAEVEADIENACGVSFVRRGRRVTRSGDGTARLHVPDRRIRKVVAASIDGVALTAAEIAEVDIVGEAARVLERGDGAWTKGRANVVVFYEFGYNQPPLRLKRAALRLLRDRMVPSNIDDRTISFTDELGTRNFAVAGGRLTPVFGIPEVDAAVAQFGEDIPGVA